MDPIQTYHKRAYKKYKHKYFALRRQQSAGNPDIRCVPNSLFDVRFESGPFSSGSDLGLSIVQSKPKLAINKPNSSFYSVLMFDPDAPTRSNPTKANWLHWMIVNDSDTIVDFDPPTPPIGSGPHRYFFYLLEQSGRISSDDLKRIYDSNNRANFDVDRFIRENQLKIISCKMFQTSHTKAS
jgi:phosphatidylethanolamine-binding protein (PEBP) family uncharacterized protein